MSRTLNTSATFNHPQGLRIRLPLPPPQGFRSLQRVQIGAIKREISDALSKGYRVRCPITGKPVQIYRHQIFRAQIRALQRLREISDEMDQAYVHVKHFGGGRRDGAFAKLALWELIKPQADAKLHEREPSDGKWMITERGRAFLEGSLRVPRQVAVLLGVRIGYVDECDLIGIKEIDDEFDRAGHLERAGVA